MLHLQKKSISRLRKEVTIKIPNEKIVLRPWNSIYIDQEKESDYELGQQAYEHAHRNQLS